MPKIIFFDVDGTLSFQNKIYDSTIQALLELKKRGHYIVVATGRSIGQCNELFELIPFDGFICFNGKYAEFHNEVIYDEKIDSNYLKEVFSDLEKDKSSYAFLSKENFLTFKENDPLIQAFVDDFKMDYPGIKDLDYIDQHDIYSIGVYSDHNINHIIEKHSNLTFMRVSSIGYDVVLKGGEKGYAIPLFLKHLGLKFEDSIAFGDNVNDLSMMENVFDSVCMGQGNAMLKEVSKYVTKPADEDGIYYALKEILKLI